MAKLTSLKHQKVYSIRTGLELLKAYQIDPSLPLRFGCCQGQCGTCVIKVEKGHDNLSRMTEQEKATLSAKQLEPACRLACQCALLGDVTIQ